MLQAQLQLDVDSPANSVSMQKHIEHALDRFQLIVVPQSGSVYKVSCSSNMFRVNFAVCLCWEKFAYVLPVLKREICQPCSCFMQIHILDPQLGPKMVHAEVKDSTGQIKFQDLDGTVLQFATAACPAKRAFA